MCKRRGRKRKNTTPPTERFLGSSNDCTPCAYLYRLILFLI